MYNQFELLKVWLLPKTKTKTKKCVWELFVGSVYSCSCCCCWYGWCGFIVVVIVAAEIVVRCLSAYVRIWLREVHYHTVVFLEKKIALEQLHIERLCDAFLVCIAVSVFRQFVRVQTHGIRRYSWKINAKWQNSIQLKMIIIAAEFFLS